MTQQEVLDLINQEMLFRWNTIHKINQKELKEFVFSYEYTQYDSLTVNWELNTETNKIKISLMDEETEVVEKEFYFRSTDLNPMNDIINYYKTNCNNLYNFIIDKINKDIFVPYYELEVFMVNNQLYIYYIDDLIIDVSQTENEVKIEIFIPMTGETVYFNFFTKGE